MSRLHWVVAWVAVLCFLAASSLSAADKKKPAASADKKKPAAARSHYETGQAAIEKVLAAKVDLDFTDTPLQEVIEYLKDYSQIEIVFDTRALGEVGIDTSTPMTKSLHNLPLRSALNLMFKEHSLTWTIQDDVLLITTLEEEDLCLSTKVYDVSDLVVCRGEHNELWDDYDTLIEAIQATFVRTSWDDVGGPGSITGASLGKAKVLIVSQTYHVHCQIADLLAQIREAAKKNPEGQLPQRNKPIGPSKKKPPEAGSTGAIPVVRPLPPAKKRPSRARAVSRPPCCPDSPGVPPGGIIPPGGPIPGRPKPPKPDDDSSNPFEPAK